MERCSGRLFAVPGSLATVGTLLYLVPRSPLYPLCPFHAITGLLCPGCGATRALVALAHGHIHEAITQNALIVLLLPALVVFAWEGARREAWPKLPVPVLLGILLVTLGFTVCRNLT